nr:MAG TPA: hypothetical protein [Caudoviricetes sp.]
MKLKNILNEIDDQKYVVVFGEAKKVLVESKAIMIEKIAPGLLKFEVESYTETENMVYITLPNDAKIDFVDDGVTKILEFTKAYATIDFPPFKTAEIVEYVTYGKEIYIKRKDVDFERVDPYLFFKYFCPFDGEKLTYNEFLKLITRCIFRDAMFSSNQYGNCYNTIIETVAGMIIVIIFNKNNHSIRVSYPTQQKIYTSFEDIVLDFRDKVM